MGRLEEMQNFVRLVEAGSISNAADQLGIAKSGVSRRLSELERRLGVRLINRTTRRSALSDAGRAYYQRAVAILSDIEELESTTSDSEASPSGMLKLAAPLSFGLSHLSPAIDEFLRRHPEVDIQIDFSDRQIDLLERGLDLAIRIADLKDSTLMARRICPIRMLLCASPAYLQKHGVPMDPSDLKQHHLLQYDAGGGGALLLTGRRGEVKVDSVHSRITANNGDFLRDMAIAGHGIVMVPSFIVWEAIAAGNLVEVMGDFCPPQRSAWAVYPQNRYLPRRARVFIDFLAEKFGENPYWDQF